LKTFDDEFYRHLFRLKGWNYDPKSTKRPVCVARLTVDLTYDRIHPDLLKQLKEVREEGKKPGSKLHQWLTTGPTGGHPRLKQHLEGVIVAMKLSNNWKEFYDRLNVLYPAFNKTMSIPFTDQDEPELDRMPPTATPPSSSTGPEPPSGQSPPAAPGSAS
jgi:hypothetical protein